MHLLNETSYKCYLGHFSNPILPLNTLPISLQNFCVKMKYNISMLNSVVASTLQITNIQNSYMIARLRITYKLEEKIWGSQKLWIGFYACS